MKLSPLGKLLKIVALMWGAFYCQGLFASEIKFFGAEPDPVELANFLFNGPVKSEPEKFTSRSLKIIEKEPAPTGVVPILFEFDSDAIKPEAFRTIETIAQMLDTNQAAGKPILIEGHTDAVGENWYNKDLSLRRAASVKNMLVQVFDVDPERLIVDGKGESELYDKSTPNSPINRRVQLKRYEEAN